MTPQEPKPPHPPAQSPTAAARAELAAAVQQSLAGAALQKLWLSSASLVTLQLRVPGRTALVVLDGRQGLLAEVAARPAGPEEAAPKSQATLRRALAGAQLASLQLELPREVPLDSARPPNLRLRFHTPSGPRALVAEPATHALLLLLGGDTDAAAPIAWASAGAGTDRRPGGTYPAVRKLDLPTGPSQDPEQRARAQAAVATAIGAEEAATFLTRKRALLRSLKSRAQKAQRALSAVSADQARAGQAADDQRKAELLLPHASKVPRGSRTATVPDWSQLDDQGAPAQVAIALDPALSAAQNAARWLKRAQRYRAALPRIAARRAELAAQLAQAEMLLARAEAATDSSELRDLELLAEPSSRRAQRSEDAHARADRPAPRRPYRAFRSRSGARILVGRGAADNDALTFRLSRGLDLWLHARGVQGAHVVVPSPSDPPDPLVLADAALLAAHFSSLRGEAGEVAWTRVKHLRKPKGAKPGAALVAQEKAIWVRPDPERLALLLQSEDG